MCREYGTLFIEVSPKTGFNVQEALLLLTKLVNGIDLTLETRLTQLFIFREMSLVEDAELRSSVRLNDFDEKGKKELVVEAVLHLMGKEKLSKSDKI